MASTTTAPPPPSRTIVLVFDDPAATVNIQEVLSTDPGTEVLAVFRKTKGSKPFIVTADKKQVATLLGRRQEAGLELLDILLGQMKQQEGDILLSRQDLRDLMARAGQDADFKPQEYSAQMGVGATPMPEGYADDELGAATQQETESQDTSSEPIDSGDQDEAGGKPTLGLMVSEEEAA